MIKVSNLRVHLKILYYCLILLKAAICCVQKPRNTGVFLRLLSLHLPAFSELSSNTQFSDTPWQKGMVNSMVSSNRKLYSILCYIWVLWLVALVAAQDDPVVKRHINQGLNLFILWTVASILAHIPILDIAGGILYILCLVLAVIGIVSAARGDDRPLPILSILTLIH